MNEKKINKKPKKIDKIINNTISEEYKKKKEPKLELTTLNNNIEGKGLALENKEDAHVQLNTLPFLMASDVNMNDINKNDKLSTFRVCPTIVTPLKNKTYITLLPTPLRIEEGKGDDIPITDRDKSEKSMVDSLAALSVKFSISHLDKNEKNKFASDDEVINNYCLLKMNLIRSIDFL